MADNTYTIKFADTSKKPISVVPKTFDDTLAIRLYGFGTPQYGKVYQENMVHLLENFCSSSEPTKTEGMTWYNSSKGKLYLCTKNTAGNLVWVDLTSGGLLGSQTNQGTGTTPSNSLPLSGGTLSGTLLLSDDSWFDSTGKIKLAVDNTNKSTAASVRYVQQAITDKINSYSGSSDTTVSGTIKSNGTVAERTMEQPLILPADKDASGDGNFAATKDFVRGLVGGLNVSGTSFGDTSKTSIGSLSNDVKRILDMIQPIGTIISTNIEVTSPTDWGSYWKLCDEEASLNLAGKSLVGYSNTDTQLAAGKSLGSGRLSIVEHSHIYRDTYAGDSLDVLYLKRSSTSTPTKFTNSAWTLVDKKLTPTGTTSTESKSRDKLKIALGPNNGYAYGSGLGSNTSSNSNAYLYKEDTTGGVTTTITQYDNIVLLNDTNCSNVGNNYPPSQCIKSRADIKLKPEQVTSNDNEYGNYHPSYAVYMYVKYKSYMD
jgi:hypothetical protein